MQEVKKKLIGYLKISRPFNSLLAGLATFIGILIAIGFNSIPEYYLEIVLAMLVTSCIAAGGYVINDYFDYEIDKINQPHRALPSGLITNKEAYIFSMILFALGFVFSIILAFVEKADNFAKLITPFLALLGIIFLYSYGSYFKRIGGVGNIIVTALVLIPFIYGGIIINQFTQSIYPILVASTLMMGREIIKDVEDVKGDQLGSAENISTLPMLIGIKRTAFLGKSFLVIFLIFSPIAFIMKEIAIYQSWGLFIAITVVDILILVAILNLRGEENELIEKATFSKKILKSALAIGVLGLIISSITPFSQLGAFNV